MNTQNIDKTLEKTLSLMEIIGEGEVYSNIDGLIEKKGYEPVYLKNSFCKYYSKQDDSDENSVFIKGNVMKHSSFGFYNSYGFAKVKPEELKKFCKIFDRNPKYNNNMGLSYKANIAGALTGVTIAFLGEKIYHNFAQQTNLMGLTPEEQTTGLIFFGVGLGALIFGNIYSKLLVKRDKKKIKKYCSILELNDQKALRLAFG